MQDAHVTKSLYDTQSELKGWRNVIYKFSHKITFRGGYTFASFDFCFAMRHIRFSEF